MTELSPAAQAVITAILEISPAPADEIAAAALRAASIYCTRERRILLTIADELEGANTTHTHK